MPEHDDPCGSLQAVQAEVKGLTNDVTRHEILIERIQNRLPVWAVLYQNSLSAVVGFLLGVVYFLARMS